MLRDDTTVRDPESLSDPSISDGSIPDEEQVQLDA